MVGGTAKAYCGKRTSGMIRTTVDAVYMNTVRMALCIVVGFVFALVENGSLSSFALQPVGMAISLLSGVCQAGFVLFWLLSVKTGAYVMVEVFILLGTILPIVVCQIFFDEQTRLLQWVGYLVLLFAVFLMCSYNNTIKAKLNAKSCALLFAAGLANGLCDLSQKLFARLQPTASKAVYNFYTFAVAAVVLGIVLLCRKSDENTVCRQKKLYLYIGVMAAGLFQNLRCRYHSRGGNVSAHAGHLPCDHHRYGCAAVRRTDHVKKRARHGIDIWRTVHDESVNTHQF